MPRNRLYDEAVRQALTVLWEAADRVCGKRLKALIPLLVDAMERHGHLDLDPVIKTKVLQVSAATIDRDGSGRVRKQSPTANVAAPSQGLASERAKEMILSRLRKSTGMPAEV